MSTLAWIIIAVLVIVIAVLSFALYSLLRGIDRVVRGFAEALWGGGKR